MRVQTFTTIIRVFSRNVCESDHDEAGTLEDFRIGVGLHRFLEL